MPAPLAAPAPAPPFALLRTSAAPTLDAALPFLLTAPTRPRSTWRCRSSSPRPRQRAWTRQGGTTVARRVWARVWAWRRSKDGGTAGVGEAEGGGAGLGTGVGEGAGVARNGAAAVTSKGARARRERGHEGHGGASWGAATWTGARRRGQGHECNGWSDHKDKDGGE